MYVVVGHGALITLSRVHVVHPLTTVITPLQAVLEFLAGADGGPCHPRDNIALSWLAHELELGYDLFHDIMDAREQQAALVADALCQHDLPIIIMGRSFKPNTDLDDGSSALLVAHYCVELHHRTVTYDAVSDQPAVYLLAHDRDYDATWAPGSVIIDMYRRHPRDAEDVEVLWYGVRDAEPPPQ